MNREAHLRQTLPQWLRLPSIGEIVIVDWSTRQPITDLLELDERIRIVRALAEPRWILSYAYNLGIAQSRGDTVLKCDADCVPSAEVVEAPPDAGKFFAGDWHTGDRVGKTCANGQCYFTRSQWEQVNGYSEVIRRYGYDDTDFYTRLEEAGHARHEIKPEQLDFVAHSDTERVANHARPADLHSVDAFLHGQLHYHEAINRVIMSFLPWGSWFPRAAFNVVDSSERLLVVRRNTAREIPIPAVLSQLAEGQAVRTMAGRLCNIPPQLLVRMDERSCRLRLQSLFNNAQSKAGLKVQQMT